MQLNLFSRGLPLYLATFAMTVLPAFAAGQTASGRVITRPGSVEDTGPMEYWSQLTEQERAGGVLLGKVEVKDEPVLWNPVAVIVTCDEKLKNSTETDTKGNFLIRPIISPSTPTLQNDPKRRLETEYEGCIVQASLAGFQSSSISITRRVVRDDPRIGTIVLQRTPGTGGTEISLTTTNAPAKAMKVFIKARNEIQQKDLASAENHLREAVKLYPAFAEAWYELGRMQEIKDPAGATAFLTKALDADPQFVPPYLQLAGLAAQQKQWQQVVDFTGHSLQLNPAGSPQVWYYDALGRSQLGQWDTAETSARKAIALDLRHQLPNAEQMLAVILVRKGNYAEARTLLQHVLTYTPAGANAELLRQQIAHLDQVLAKSK